LPDGREALLYGSFEPAALPAVRAARPPRLYQRWHPLLAEWVVVAAGRQARTFHPRVGACPLCPSRPGRATEVPARDFDIAIFENRFPSLRLDARLTGEERAAPTPTRPARGRCEVVVYTAAHEGGLATLDPEKMRRLVEVWTDRARELEALPAVRCCFIFENRGEAVGTTLHHPHGQIYAYGFVPPIVQRELQAFRRYRRQREGCLLCDLWAQERRLGTRIVEDMPRWTALVPYYARWAYEVHVAPRRHAGALTDLTAAERRGLATMLQRVAARYDALFQRPLPYIMAMHQRPVKGRDDDAYHFHIEFYPPHRTRDKLKYQAGSEVGMGVFLTDTLVEDTSRELRRALAPG